VRARAIGHIFQSVLFSSLIANDLGGKFCELRHIGILGDSENRS
jgi:hypothetical protein